MVLRRLKESWFVIIRPGSYLDQMRGGALDLLTFYRVAKADGRDTVYVSA